MKQSLLYPLLGVVFLSALVQLPGSNPPVDLEASAQAPSAPAKGAPQVCEAVRGELQRGRARLESGPTNPGLRATVESLESYAAGACA